MTYHEYVLQPRRALAAGPAATTALDVTPGLISPGLQAAGGQAGLGPVGQPAACPLGQSHLADDRNCHVFYHCVRTYWGLHMTRKSCGQFLMFNSGEEEGNSNDWILDEKVKL